MSNLVSYNPWYQTGNYKQMDYLLKMIIIGDSSVGKSTFLYRLADNLFIYENEPTIGVEFKSMVALSKSPYIYNFKLQLWDTSGQDRFRSIVKSYYRYAQGCFLVFDITDRNSWINLQKWYDDLKNNVDILDKQIMLLGTKLDLQENRKVSTEEGQKFAIDHGLAGYVEISSKTGVGISQSLSILIQSLAELIGTGQLELEPKLGLGTICISDAPAEPGRCCSYI